MSKFVLRNNKQLGVPFIVNGEPTVFRFGGHALAELEGSLGMTQDELLKLAVAGGLSVRLTVAMLRAALLHEEPQLTLAEAGEILTPYLKTHEEFQALRLALGEALVLAFPPIPAGDEPKNAEALSGTGTSTVSLAPESV